MKSLATRRTMLAKGKRLAKHLPGYRVLGVDPGYLFVSDKGPSIDLPESVVDSLLQAIGGQHGKVQ